MDRGPFRGQRPVDKGATSRPELTPQQSEDVSQPTVEPQQQMQPEEPVSLRRASATKAPRRTPQGKALRGRLGWPFWVVTIIAIVIIASGVVCWGIRNVSAGIDGGKYQAVFFTNGQVYFGKLHTFNGQSMKLTDIYYLQTQSNSKNDAGNPQQTTTDQSNVQLIKLGDEIHGPEDEMIIAKDQVLFYENLKPDSKVVQSINKFQKAN